MFDTAVVLDPAPAEQPASLSCLIGYPTHGERVAACLAAVPGPLMVQALTCVDPARLTTEEQLDLVRAWERCSSWLAAMQAAALAAIDLHDAGDAVLADRTVADEALKAELAAALALSPEASGRRVVAARLLRGRFAATGAALAAGRLGYLHALAITEELGPVDPAVASVVETRVLARAGGRTVGSLRRLLRHEIVRADPTEADRRAARARARRRVRVWPGDDGMGVLQVVHGAGELRFVHDTLDAWARDRGADRPGGIGLDAGRADALVDLCRLAVSGGLVTAGPPATASGNERRADRTADATASRPGQASPGLPSSDIAATPARAAADGLAPAPPGPLPVCVNVTMSLETLLGVRDDPAYLERHGVLPPGVARELARDARWRRFVTDPVDGHLLDCGRVYEAPARLRRYLVERDRTCRYPGCVRAARRCDCDHAEPYALGGETSAANCGMLCRRHHRLKTLGLLRLVRAPDGSVTWTTRLGRVYRVKAPAPDDPV